MRSYRWIYAILVIAVMGALPMVNGCDDDPENITFFEEEELLISDYLEAHRDHYSTLIQVLELTGLKRTLNAYGHYTFFAPDNDAFMTFLEENGKTSVDEFETAYLDNLVKYHLLNVRIESSYFRAGVIQDTTLSGDNLVVTFSEGGLETMMVNEAGISQRDIYVENGIIHRLEQVMTPIVGSIMDRLLEEGSYSVFCEALEMTGLADTLDVITLKLNEKISYRTRFTIFAETDQVLAGEGIMSAQDLAARYSDTGNPADRDDGLYRFMAYHIIPDLIFLNDLDTFNYSTLASNQLVNVSIRGDIFLNAHESGQGGDDRIRVVPEGSNKQAKNGTFHQVSGLLEPVEPPPVYLVMDLTNYQGISLGREYTEQEMKDIGGIIARNTGIYFRNSILSDGETNLQTTDRKAGWSVEFILPPVMRGRYDIYFHWASYQGNCGWAQAFWDGARLGNTFSFVHSKRWPGREWKYDYNTSEYMGRLVLTETVPHTIRFVSLEDGYGVFDYLVLIPVGD